MSRRNLRPAHKRIATPVSVLSSPSHPPTMPPVNDALHGWSPVGADDEDVSVSQDMRFITIKPFPVSPSAFLSPICPPLDTKPKIRSSQSKSPPLAPSTGVSHSVASSSDRRAQRNRNRDPSWIPRPRNAFIIFRCEYSREHSQGSQESQSDDDTTNPTVKTLSKRAAEAWKQLPAVEKERYKALADKEREEHARLYPHYRFRPMKRQTSGQRKTSRECSQDPRIPSVERPLAPSAHLPSVLTRAPEKPRSSPPVDHVNASTSVPQAGGLSLSEQTDFTDSLVEPRAPVPLSLDYNDPLLSETAFPSDLSPPPAPAELYAPLCRSAVSIPPDAFRYDTPSGVDLVQEDTERAQALQAYAIGLYNYDLFPPFSFPEYY